ncbi:hypothetical protein LguiA_003717 [Lonicera macranthoides]
MEVLLKLVLSHYLLFLLIGSVLTQQLQLSSSADRSALFELRWSLGIRARDWPRKVDPCLEWVGVECINGRVVGINLTSCRRSRIGRLNPRFSVDSLVNFTVLVSFNSSGFSLPGSIPEWFGQGLTALQVLDLSSSSILGTIPSSLGTMTTLNSLYLSDNSLTGVIPPTLASLSSLLVLDLSHNLLTGSIPSSFSGFGNLSKLDLSANFLSGPIPSGFGSISTLQFLNLNNNSLSGSVPVQLGNLSKLIELDLGFNSLSGTLSEELGGMTSLQKMSLENNELEGPFSGSLLLNLTQLQNVVLSWNHFNGELSDSFGSMPQLRFLDISGNNFTGVLPDLASLFNVTSAVFNFSSNLFYGNLNRPIGNFGLLDLSDNYFQGSVPNITGRNIAIKGNCFMRVPNQKSSEDCRIFYANRGLSFNNDELNPKQPSKSTKRLTYVMVGLFGGIGFIVLLALVLVLLLNICHKGNEIQGGNSNVVPVHEEANTPPPKVTADLSGLGESFTYKQLLEATSDFCDANLIKNGHSGDLFWGTLENEFSVVIKKVDLRSFGSDSYLLELDLFSKVAHSRLVPLLGHCLEHENEKLLVYKYMPYGDLSNSLYRFTNLEDGIPQSLDWITRLKIAIGAAEGLAYLHHECNPPLVHRDIQASSILLDDKYEVRLGSLSETRAQGEDRQNMITRFLRIPQTSEQNPSDSPSTSCTYDVYCFGKVLLELVTGKLGLSQEWLDQNLPFINIYEKEPMAKIVDQSLIVDEDLLEEVWAVAIVAKSCLNPKPSKRPLMRHILRALENPFRVVRDDNFSSSRLRTTSSRRSWSAAFFGSWRNSSFESAHFPREATREEQSGLKQAGRLGSQGSGTNTNGHSSSHKRLSSEIFPEPMEMQDLETVDENRQ